MDATPQAMGLLHQVKAKIWERREKAQIRAYLFNKRNANTIGLG